MMRLTNKINALFHSNHLVSFFSKIGLTISILVFTVFSSSAHGITDNDLSFPHYMEEALACEMASSGSVTVNKDVYMLGDSISVLSLQQLTNSFQQKHITPVKINADGGRAINTDTGPPGTSGKQAVTDDGNLDNKPGGVNVIKDADIAVVALGTNSKYEDLSVEIPNLVNMIRQAKPEIPIYWVNLFYTTPTTPTRDDRNKVIKDQESKIKNFKVIDTVSANIKLSSDRTHPEGEGLYQFAEVVAKGVTGDTTKSSNGLLSIRYPNFEDEASVGKKIEDFIRSTTPSSPWLSIRDFGNRLVQDSKSYDVNPLMVVVIGRQESTYGISDVASQPRGSNSVINYNSFGNKGTPDTNGDGYKEWSSFESSLLGEGSFTQAIENRINGGHANYVNVKTMYEYLSVHLTGRILYPGDSTSVYDPIMQEWVDVSGVITYYENAKTWISEALGVTITDDDNVSASNCASESSNGAVAGNVVQTALGLAWTEANKLAQIEAAVKATTGVCSMRDNPSSCGQIKAGKGAYIKESDARDTYVTAVKAVNSTNASDGANWAFSDCGVFVATVMRASTVDPEYMQRGTGLQLQYVQNNPKYDVIPFTDTSQAQPGDVFIKDGHTYIYVGPNTTGFDSADASWGQHVPTVGHNLWTNNGYYRVRKI